MKLYQQFDLNTDVLRISNFNDIPRAMNEVPSLVEQLTRSLVDKGYIVIKSSAYYMGIPQSITIAKDFTGPFITLFSAKLKEDFDNISIKLGINKLFK